MTANTSLAENACRELADPNDRIVGPEDPGYEEARAVPNGMISRHPAVLVRCSSADEVTRAIAFALAHGAAIGVRRGGHNGGGLGVVDDGVVVDRAGMAETPPGRRHHRHRPRRHDRPWQPGRLDPRAQLDDSFGVLATRET